MTATLPKLNPRRINIGAGNYPLKGFTNYDAHTAGAGVHETDVFELTLRDVDEVNLSHVLEHISWRRTVELLARIHSWMADGGTLTVEVPDMELILPRGCEHPLWFKYIYGDQSHDGEYHKAGFTHQMLRADLVTAGWMVVMVRRFESEHPGREGMPCLEAVARA